MEILATVLTGVLPLMGVWLGSHLQGRDKRQDLAREHRAMLRVKVEEMFELVAKLRAGTGPYIRTLISSGQFYDVNQSPTFVGYHRLQTLTAIYFPDGEHLVVNHRALLAKAVEDAPHGDGRTADQYYDDVGSAAGEEAVRFCNEFREFLLAKIEGLGADPSQKVGGPRRLPFLK